MQCYRGSRTVIPRNFEDEDDKGLKNFLNYNLELKILNSNMSQYVFGKK